MLEISRLILHSTWNCAFFFCEENLEYKIEMHLNDFQHRFPAVLGESFNLKYFSFHSYSRSTKTQKKVN